jgi:hypothetical protein
MECNNCKIVLENGNITAEFTTVGGEEKIDVIVMCPKCEKRFYQFVSCDKLCTD